MNTLLTTVLPVVQAVTSPPITVIRESVSVHSTVSPDPQKNHQSSSSDGEINTPIKKRMCTSTLSSDNDSDHVVSESSDTTVVSSISDDISAEESDNETNIPIKKRIHTSTVSSDDDSNHVVSESSDTTVVPSISDDISPEETVVTSTVSSDDDSDHVVSESSDVQVVPSISDDISPDETVVTSTVSSDNDSDHVVSESSDVTVVPSISDDTSTEESDDETNIPIKKRIRTSTLSSDNDSDHGVSESSVVQVVPSISDDISPEETIVSTLSTGPLKRPLPSSSDEDVHTPVKKRIRPSTISSTVDIPREIPITPGFNLFGLPVIAPVPFNNPGFGHMFPPTIMNSNTMTSSSVGNTVPLPIFPGTTFSIPSFLSPGLIPPPVISGNGLFPFFCPPFPFPGLNPPPVNTGIYWYCWSISSSSSIGEYN